jgi:hypothetical protein
MRIPVTILLMALLSGAACVKHPAYGTKPRRSASVDSITLGSDSATPQPER